MKHIFNDLSNEEKNSIREQHSGGMKVVTENFSRLLNSKLGDSKPLVAEQAVAPDMVNWINYPFYLGKYKPKADRKLTAMSIPQSTAVVFIKPASNVQLEAQVKFDNKMVFGITGDKWIVSPGLTTENVIFGNLASGTVGSPTPGEFYAIRVNAKPATVASTDAEPNPEATGKSINIGMNNQPTEILKLIKPRLDYGGFAKDAWNIITNSAKVELNNPWVDLILPITQFFVKSGVVSQPTPEQVKLDPYRLLTSIK